MNPKNNLISKVIVFYLALFLSFSNAQNTYLDEAGWEWLSNSSNFFDQAFSAASTGAVPALLAQQYTLTLTQLFEASRALESDLRGLQGEYQQSTDAIPFDLIYLTTAVGALSSGISSLTDYYQQLQEPNQNQVALQSNLRFAHLNNTIYWLSLSLYYEKSAD